MAILLSASCINAKTLVVYYSFTNNVHTIVNNLHTQIDADVIRMYNNNKSCITIINNVYRQKSFLKRSAAVAAYQWSGSSRLLAKDNTASKGNNKQSNSVIDDKNYRHLMGLGFS